MWPKYEGGLRGTCLVESSDAEWEHCNEPADSCPPGRIRFKVYELCARYERFCGVGSGRTLLDPPAYLPCLQLSLRQDAQKAAVSELAQRLTIKACVADRQG